MAQSRTVPASRRRSDAVRNRAQLLEAARRQLADGDDTLALNALARCAGVGIGTAYRHVPNRATLVEGLAADALAAFVTDARSAADDPDPARGLATLLRAGLAGMAGDHVLAEVLRSPHPVCVETIGLSRELGTALGELLDRARAAGAVSPDLGADDLRRLLVGVHTAASAGPHPDAARERYLRVLVAGLAG